MAKSAVLLLVMTCSGVTGTVKQLSSGNKSDLETQRAQSFILNGALFSYSHLSGSNNYILNTTGGGLCQQGLPSPGLALGFVCVLHCLLEMAIECCKSPEDVPATGCG